MKVSFLTPTFSSAPCTCNATLKLISRKRTPSSFNSVGAPSNRRRGRQSTVRGALRSLFQAIPHLDRRATQKKTTLPRVPQISRVHAEILFHNQSRRVR